MEVKKRLLRRTVGEGVVSVIYVRLLWVVLFFLDLTKHNEYDNEDDR